MHTHYAFVGGQTGNWRVRSMTAVTGAGLEPAAALEIAPLPLASSPARPAWALYGLRSNVRYATREELTALAAKQEPLDRPSARFAALIPIKKTAQWWTLAQDERRAIFEDQSRHTAIGLEYLPAIARQLYHCRDLSEPFDFLTWFEYAPEHEASFDALLARLRKTCEWGYVEREVDIRLLRG